MAASLVSSIIFFLLFIILSLFVDGNVFAAQMEHRKLGGVKETMTMRRNLQENGRQGSKIRTSPSISRHTGQKNTRNKPSETRPNQVTPQRKNYLTYKALTRNQVPCKLYDRCKHSFSAPSPSPLPSSSKGTQGLGH